MLYGLKSMPDSEVKLVKVKNFLPINSSKVFKYFVNECAVYTILFILAYNAVALPLLNICTLVFT